MSIIWGAVSLDGRPITEEQKEILKAPVLRCRTDRLTEVNDDGVYLGCAMQYVTKESKSEELPTHNAEADTWFDADVFLDNRDEVGKKLGLSAEKTAILPDGELLYRFVSRYGEDGLNDILGAYTFVYYDRKNIKLLLVDDAVGNRCVYYRIIGQTLYFATFMESLRALGKNTVNGKWVSYFIAQNSLGIFSDLNETPAKEIRRPSPGGYVVFDENGVREIQYWTPMTDFREIHLKNDDEYKEAFRELMSNAVTCMLRSDYETGINLSGGFDSNAVNAYAAPFLEKQGKKLYSFTMIPEKGLETQSDGRLGTLDESDDVLKTAGYFKNLECSFLDLKDVNLWETDKEMLITSGMPFKSVYNRGWFHTAYKHAGEKGIRLMLTGEYGNLGVSYGNYELYLKELWHKQRYIKMFKEAKLFCANNRYSYKHFIKLFISSRIKPEKNEYSGIKGTFLLKGAPGFDEAERLLKEDCEIAYRSSESYAEARKKLSRMLILRQISDSSPATAAMEGILVRDPTRDKKLIEWCTRIPLEQFAKNGVRRRLVREYLRGIVPDHILEHRDKGVQASDFKPRIIREWDQIKRDVLNEIERTGDSEWIDLEMLKLAITGNPNELNYWKIYSILYTTLLLTEINRLLQL